MRCLFLSTKSMMGATDWCQIRHFEEVWGQEGSLRQAHRRHKDAKDMIDLARSVRGAAPLRLFWRPL
jgi:hypothetical protein